MNDFKVTIGKPQKQAIYQCVYSIKCVIVFGMESAIDIHIKCIESPTLLKAAFELKLREGWRPAPKKKDVKEVPITVIQALDSGY